PLICDVCAQAASDVKKRLNRIPRRAPIETPLLSELSLPGTISAVVFDVKEVARFLPQICAALLLEGQSDGVRRLICSVGGGRPPPPDREAQRSYFEPSAFAQSMNFWATFRPRSTPASLSIW